MRGKSAIDSAVGLFVAFAVQFTGIEILQAASVEERLN